MHAQARPVLDRSGVTVRGMVSADIAAVLAILRESPEASAWSEESLYKWSVTGGAWVAEWNQTLAGFLIGRLAAGEFEILNLAVRPAFRRRKVATQLVSATLADAAAAGAIETYLEVRASNRNGIAFYKGMRFRVCGRRPNYYRDPVEDAVLLVRRESETDL